MQDLIAKAGTLLEALPYIQRFSHVIFVVKYGGSFMDSPDPAIREGVARDIVFLEAVEVDPVVVHGGGKAINTFSSCACEFGLEHCLKRIRRKQRVEQRDIVYGASCDERRWCHR